MEFIQTHKTFIYSLLFIVFFSVSVSYATTPSFHTLDPQCAPTDPSCVVSPIVDSSEILYDPISRTLSVNPSATYISFIDTTTQSFSGNKTFLGNISGINGVAYSFPGTQGTANSLLINDGNGNLTWTPQTSLALWSTSGNTGTTPGTNFIGTTDAQDLVFKTNGVERMRIMGNSSTTGVAMLFSSGNQGTVTMGNYGGTLFGTAYTAGSSIALTGSFNFVAASTYTSGSSITASGYAASVFGVVGYGGTPATVTASGAGSYISGYYDAGTITASLYGSRIMSTTLGTGSPTLTASGNASFIHVLAQNGGTVTAAGWGTMISGMVSGSTSSMITLASPVGTNGAHVFGAADTGGSLVGAAAGSFTGGYAENNGLIRAGSSTVQAHGSIALGYANSGTIIADSDGSLAGGYAPSGANIYTNGLASFVWGSGVSNGTTGTPADYGIVFGKNISNTASNTMIVGWDTVQLLINNSGVTINKFLQVGNSVITTGTSVAKFQNAGGTCTVIPSTSGGITCTSDITLKKNITTLDSNSTYTLTSINTPTSATTLDKIMSLSPVAYNWNIESDTDQKHTGFIAQEVAQVFPDLVTTDQATNIKSLSYTGFVPYLTKAVQELNVKITDIQHLQGETRNSLFSVLQDWFASTENGIATLIVGKVKAKEICATDEGGETCVDKNTLVAIFAHIQSTQTNQ